jgi:hypothetical protein
VAPATYNVFEVRAELRNEVTGEPHLHIYTIDYEEAQAFFYTLGSFISIDKLDIHYHENVWEGTIIDCCTGCEAARDDYSREYATW